MSLTVDTGDVAAEIDGLIDRARNLRPALDDVVDDFHTLMREGFATAGAAIGSRWAANVPGWARQKPGRPVGRFTGILEASLTRQQASYAIHDISGTGVRLGSSAPHAAMFDRGRGGQRARNLEPASNRLEARWLPLLQDHLDGAGFDGIL